METKEDPAIVCTPTATRFLIKMLKHSVEKRQHLNNRIGKTGYLCVEE